MNAIQIPLKQLENFSENESHFLPEKIKLTESFKAWGQLNPIAVKQTLDQQYEIIDGFLRTQISRDLNLNTICAIVYEAISPIQQFWLNLELNSLSRSFNLVEKAFILKKSKTVLTTDEVNEKLLPGLDVKKNQVQDLLDLLKLDFAILEKSVTLSWPLNLTALFLNFAPEIRLEIFNQLNKLPLNQNKWQEILGFLSLITKKNECNTLTLLHDFLKQSQDTNDHIIIEKLRTCLQEEARPRLKNKKNQFDTAVSRLKLPNTVRIEASQYFEEEWVEIKMRVSSVEECQKLAFALQKEEWSSLFKILS